MSSWYVNVGGQSHGPMTDTAFEQMRASGGIPPNALVWRNGMQSWVPMSTLFGGPPPASFPAAATAATPQERGRMPGVLIAAYVMAICSLGCFWVGVPGGVICSIIAMTRPGWSVHAVVALVLSLVCGVIGFFLEAMCGAMLFSAGAVP